MEAPLFIVLRKTHWVWREECWDLLSQMRYIRSHASTCDESICLEGDYCNQMVPNSLSFITYWDKYKPTFTSSGEFAQSHHTRSVPQWPNVLQGRKRAYKRWIKWTIQGTMIQKFHVAIRKMKRVLVEMCNHLQALYMLNKIAWNRNMRIVELGTRASTSRSSLV